MSRGTLFIFVSIVLVYTGTLAAVSPHSEVPFDEKALKKVNLNHKLSGHQESQYTKEMLKKRVKK